MRPPQLSETWRGCEQTVQVREWNTRQGEAVEVGQEMKRLIGGRWSGMVHVVRYLLMPAVG